MTISPACDGVVELIIMFVAVVPLAPPAEALSTPVVSDASNSRIDMVAEEAPVVVTV
jgi:hypothetical protein